jgi:hypothetical protein
METMGTIRLFENATEAQAHDRGFKAAWHCTLTRKAAYGDEADLPQGLDHAWREVSDRELAQEVEVDALHADFRLVADPADWKAPISSVIAVPELEQEPESVDAFKTRLARAIVYFTASNARFTTLVGLSGVSLRVEADGYRGGPVGDR